MWSTPLEHPIFEVFEQPGWGTAIVSPRVVRGVAIVLIERDRAKTTQSYEFYYPEISVGFRLLTMATLFRLELM